VGWVWRALTEEVCVLRVSDVPRPDGVAHARAG